MRLPRVRLTVRCLLAVIMLVGLALGSMFGRWPIASVEAVTPKARPITSSEGPTHYTLSGLIPGKSYRQAWAIVNRGSEPLVIWKAGSS